MNRFAALKTALIITLTAINVHSQIKIVDNGPDSARIVIAIIGDGYRSQDMAQYAGMADSCTNGFFLRAARRAGDKLIS